MEKVMGLDVGTKRIGIALSDYLLITAQPCETISRLPETQAIEKIKSICAQNNVKKIIVGLPKHMNGDLSVQSQDCMSFAALLQDDFEILFEDERLTSTQAEKILATVGHKYTKNKGLVDLKSACLILQQYLDRK